MQLKYKRGLNSITLADLWVCVGIIDDICAVPLCWHIEAWSKWPTICRRNFQMHFCDRNFYILVKISFFEFVSINNTPSLVRMIAWHQTSVRCIFVNEKFRILTKIPLKFIAKGPIDYNPALGLDSGLAPNRRQAIIWTNAGPIHWRIYTALGGNELKGKIQPMPNHGIQIRVAILLIPIANFMTVTMETSIRKSHRLHEGFTLINFSIQLIPIDDGVRRHIHSSRRRDVLTHGPLVTPYCVIEFGQYQYLIISTDWD